MFLDFERFVNSFLAIASRLFKGVAIHIVMTRFKIAVLFFFGFLSIWVYRERLTGPLSTQQWDGGGIIFVFIFAILAVMGCFFVWIDAIYIREWKKTLGGKVNNKKQRSSPSGSRGKADHIV